MDVQDLIDQAGGVTKLARLCHVSHSTICDWNRDNFLPGNRVPGISKALGIDARLLMPLVKAPQPRLTEAA